MPTEFGEKLHKLRKYKEYSLEALADKISSTKSYIWDLENKPNIRPSAETVYKLATALDTTVDVLMGEKSMEDADEDDKVFFRKYQPLKPETKKQLSRIMDVLLDEDDKT
jgi:transcriptional regulator with XRE-family HTH domain